MTGTEMKKEIKKILRNEGGKAYKISISYALFEEEEQEQYDVMANVYYYNRYGHDEFQDFLLGTFEEEKTAVTKSKRLYNTLCTEWGDNVVKYSGLENC